MHPKLKTILRYLRLALRWITTGFLLLMFVASFFNISSYFIPFFLLLSSVLLAPIFDNNFKKTKLLKNDWIRYSLFTICFLISFFTIGYFGKSASLKDKKLSKQKIQINEDLKNSHTTTHQSDSLPKLDTKILSDSEIKSITKSLLLAKDYLDKEDFLSYYNATLELRKIKDSISLLSGNNAKSDLVVEWLSLNKRSYLFQTRNPPYNETDLRNTNKIINDVKNINIEEGLKLEKDFFEKCYSGIKNTAHKYAPSTTQNLIKICLEINPNDEKAILLFNKYKSLRQKELENYNNRSKSCVLRASKARYQYCVKIPPEECDEKFGNQIWKKGKTCEIWKKEYALWCDKNGFSKESCHL